jgi:hypothetical protein
LAGATIDHLISITIFLAAILLFVNLFSQTNQTAIIYEQHRAVATKCSDLLDNILLNPGSPSYWGQKSDNVTGFGVQDPEFTEYQASPFSLMRLAPSTADTIVYDKNSPDVYYSDVSMGFGQSLLMSNAAVINYSLALKLLGINNTYGFQLTLTPVVNVSIIDDYSTGHLRLNISLSGLGFPLAGASINYCLILVSLSAETGFPSYTMQGDNIYADGQGLASVEFPATTNAQQCYAFIVYAHLGGIGAMGFHEYVSSSEQHVVPIVNDLSQHSVLIAHNYDLNSSNPLYSTLKYNATFVLSSVFYNGGSYIPYLNNLTGNVVSGVGNPYVNISIPESGDNANVPYSPGILIITYQQADDATKGGVVVMPWGISALAFPVTFGGNPQKQEWVATDLRQVTVNHVSYQAKLALWSYQGQQVVVPQR